MIHIIWYTYYKSTIQEIAMLEKENGPFYL